MRHAATHSLLTRRDVIIVASVSLHLRPRLGRGYYEHARRARRRARSYPRDKLLRKLVDIQYERNDIDFHRGTFRVRGDVGRGLPGLRGGARHPHRVLRRHDREHPRDRSAARQGARRRSRRSPIFPGSPLRHPREQRAQRASSRIREELRERLRASDAQGKLLEAQRLEQRTHVRPRDDRADGLLQRHRELLAPPLRAQAPASRRRRSSTTSPRTSC